MKHVLCLIALVCAASAAPIVSSTAACAIYNVASGAVVQSVSDPSSCVLGSNSSSMPSASAQAYYGLQFGGNSLMMSASTFASADFSVDSTHYGAASASVQYTEFYRTAGGTRPGLAMYYFDFHGIGGGSAEAPWVFFDGAVRPVEGQAFITLGTVDKASVDASTGVNGIYFIGNQNAAVFLRLSFYEVDGVTPVNVYIVPEPSTMLFVGFGVTAVLTRRGRNRSRHSCNSQSEEAL